MNVEPFLVASAVEGAIAQRLVRKICSKCKVPYFPSEKLMYDLKLPTGTQFFKGKGCGHCRNTGYMGRIGLFEVLRTNDAIRDLVISRPTTSAVRNLAKQQNMHTLWEDGMQKVMAGITTIDEVMRETEKV